MHILKDIEERMEEELKALCKKETWTPTDVELVGEMIDIVKDVETVYAMKDYEPEDWMRGYSRGYDEDYSMARMPYGRSYDDRMSREGNRSYGDNSYVRGRDAMGRYVSRDDSRHDLIEHLRTMMDNARTPEERESYRNAIDHMSRN